MTDTARTAQSAQTPTTPPVGAVTPGPHEEEEAGPTSRASVLRGRLGQGVQQLLAFGTLIALVAFFSVVSSNFLTVSNMSSILLSTAVIGILAVGTTLVIITGGIDLSIGTGMTLCSVVTGLLLTSAGLPLAVGVAGGILMGAFIGLVNGFNVAVLGLPPFIATLAMMLVAQGLALVLSGVRPIYLSGVPGYSDIALGSIVPNVPNAVLVLFGLALVFGFILAKTVLGRMTYAIGSNEEATRLSGINTRRWLIAVYALAGSATGLAGVVIAARLNSVQPQLGLGYELQAIAAVIIGGTSLLGGRGSILGTLIGALIMSVLINGLRIMAIQTEWQTVVVGVVVLVAVFADNLRRRRSGVGT